jgi:hypothetical protein
MRNTVYFKWFLESLTEDQKKEYSDMGMNQQKDWYISFLEKFFNTSDYSISRITEKF